jgi:hypothetical protein
MYGSSFCLVNKFCLLFGEVQRSGVYWLHQVHCKNLADECKDKWHPLECLQGGRRTRTANVDEFLGEQHKMIQLLLEHRVLNVKYSGENSGSGPVGLHIKVKSVGWPVIY